MTQQQLANLSILKTEQASLKARLAHVEGEINKAFKDCDHKNPNGRKAIVTGYIHDSCAICDRVI